MNNSSKLALTGGHAVAYALRQMNPDVMPVYPITPQTPIIETFAKFQAEKLVDTELIIAESEHSAISAAVGASAAGARTVTATSSQGLALMNEILYIASGLRLPILMAVSARALSAPLNIHCDHSDVMGARDTGWIQIFAENVQEAYDNTIIGMKLAEHARIPVMAIMDGFITSHSIENLDVLEDRAVRKFVGKYKPEESLLDVENPVSYGMMALPNKYFDFKIDQHNALVDALNDFQTIADDFSKISGRPQGIFETYKTEDADAIMVVAGSTAGTAKEAVDKLRAEGQKVGLLKIKLFRPFPHDEIFKALSGAKKIAVLDRSMSFGTYPPIYQEIVISMNRVSSIGKIKINVIKNTQRIIQPYVYGLGGRDIFVAEIEKVFDDLLQGEISNEIKYIGIKDN